MKTCTKCGVAKPLTEFHKLRNGKRPDCKACRVVSSREYVARNAEVINAKAKENYHANHEMMRARAAEDYQKHKAARCAAQNEYHRKLAGRPLDKGDAHLPKRCAPGTSGGCGALLTRGDFYRHRMRADQRFMLCKTCSSDRDSRYRKTCATEHGPAEASSCYLCGLPNDADAWVDHLVPQSKADTYRFDIHTGFNLRWVHASCNMHRKDKPVTAEQFKRLLRLDGVPLTGWTLRA